MAPTRSRSIAVLLAGELRGFLSLTVQASVRRHALEAMSSAATTTSLFVVLKLTAGELASQRAQSLTDLRLSSGASIILRGAEPAAVDNAYTLVFYSILSRFFQYSCTLPSLCSLKHSKYIKQHFRKQPWSSMAVPGTTLQYSTIGPILLAYLE